MNISNPFAPIQASDIRVKRNLTLRRKFELLDRFFDIALDDLENRELDRTHVIKEFENIDRQKLVPLVTRTNLTDPDDLTKLNEILDDAWALDYFLLVFVGLNQQALLARLNKFFVDQFITLAPRKDPNILDRSYLSENIEKFEALPKRYRDYLIDLFLTAEVPPLEVNEDEPCSSGSTSANRSGLEEWFMDREDQPGPSTSAESSPKKQRMEHGYEEDPATGYPGDPYSQLDRASFSKIKEEEEIAMKRALKASKSEVMLRLFREIEEVAKIPDAATREAVGQELISSPGLSFGERDIIRFLCIDNWNDYKTGEELRSRLNAIAPVYELFLFWIITHPKYQEEVWKGLQTGIRNQLRAFFNKRFAFEVPESSSLCFINRTYYLDNRTVIAALPEECQVFIQNCLLTAPTKGHLDGETYDNAEDFVLNGHKREPVKVYSADTFNGLLARASKALDASAPSGSRK